MRDIRFAFQQLSFLPSDIIAAFRGDPALRGKVFGFLEVFTYAGVWALFSHRICHLLNALYVPFLPRFFSQVTRFLTGIEIHPGAKIQKGFFIDHGMGVVIGETAEIGENVLIYHQVTLGGTSLQSGKRHPTVGNNVLIGAGAKIFGPLTIGDNAQIGGGAVVVKNVPKNYVAVGNPAHNKMRKRKDLPPNLEVDQIHLPDPYGVRKRRQKKNHK